LLLNSLNFVHLSFQSVNQRGSFLSRNSDTLERIAELTKGSCESRTGTGAKNTKNFVFAALSPDKGVEDHESQKKTKAPRKRTAAALASDGEEVKQPKLPRTIDENSVDTIFGRM